MFEVICTICGRTFFEHIEHRLECRGDFPEHTVLAAPPDRLGLWPKARTLATWFLRHPIQNTRDLAWGFRFAAAHQVRLSCEQSYSLAHARMVHDRLLEMSWAGFLALAGVMAAFVLATNVLEVLGLGKIVTRAMKWFQHEDA